LVFIISPPLAAEQSDKDAAKTTIVSAFIVTSSCIVIDT
jgi:hypothetical protein